MSEARKRGRPKGRTSDVGVRAKAGRYYIRYKGREEATPFLVGQKEGKKAARELRARRLLEYADDALPVDRTYTWDTMLSDYLAQLQRDGKASVRTVPSQIDMLLDRTRFADGPERFGKDGLHGLLVHKTSTQRLETLQDSLLTTYKPTTVNRALATAKAAFNYAADDVTPPRVTRRLKFPKMLSEHASVRQGFVYPADFARVLAEVRNPHLADFIDWLYASGARKGEVSQLTWLMYDRHTTTLLLPARITKTKKPKRVPVRGRLLAIIERRWAARVAYAEQTRKATGVARPPELIFWRPRQSPLSRQGEPVCIYDFRKAWRTALRRAGLDESIIPHDLRRSAVRNFDRAADGALRKQAMQLTGHRTESTYARYNIGDDTDVVTLLERTDAYVTQHKEG